MAYEKKTKPEIAGEMPLQGEKKPANREKPANGVKNGTGGGENAAKKPRPAAKKPKTGEKAGTPAEKTEKPADGARKTTSKTKKAADSAGKAANKTEPPENSAGKAANKTETPENGAGKAANKTATPENGAGKAADDAAKQASPSGGAFPPVLWENTLPDTPTGQDEPGGAHSPQNAEHPQKSVQNTQHLPGYSADASLPTAAGAGLPAKSGGHAVGRASVPVDFPERLTKKSIARRVLVLLLAVAVLGAAMFIFFFRPAEYTEKIGSVIAFYNDAENSTIVIVNGRNIGNFAGRAAAQMTDGRGVTAVLRAESGELWLVCGGKMRLAAEAVTDATLSADGSTFAFRTQAGVLYRSGTGKKDVLQLISNGATDDPFCLSPDGKELLYTSATGGTPCAEVFSARGKAPYLTDTGNYRPVAIADKSRYVYFRDADNTLYIYNAKTARITNCGAFAEDSLVFNRDFSEVFFSTAESCRFYRNGTALTLTGLSGGETLRLLPNQRVTWRENICGVQYLQKSLLGCYYDYAAVGGSRLAYLSVKKDKVQMEVIHFFDEGTATVTDKYVFFVSTDQTATDVRANLYAVKTGKTGFERLMADVAEYCANVDGSRILYRDAHGPLRAMRMGAAPTQLADGFLGGTLCVTLDDTFYYRGEDGALYRSENGEMPEKVADGVRFAATDAHVAFFLCENGGQYELYANYRGRRKNTMVAAFPLAADDDAS